MRDDNSVKPNDEKPMSERARRMRVLKAAHAGFNNQFSAVPCVVRDMSDTGARIEFDLGWIVPSQFTLYIELDGLKVNCEKIWSRGKIHGVRFIGEKTRTKENRKQIIENYDLKFDEINKVEQNINSLSHGVLKTKKPCFGKL